MQYKEERTCCLMKLVLKLNKKLWESKVKVTFWTFISNFWALREKWQSLKKRLCRLRRTKATAWVK